MTTEDHQKLDSYTIFLFLYKILDTLELLAYYTIVVRRAVGLEQDEISLLWF